jgi:hypothetical protein
MRLTIRFPCWQEKASYPTTVTHDNADAFFSAVQSVFGPGVSCNCFAHLMSALHTRKAKYAKGLPDDVLQTLKDDVRVLHRISSPPLAEAAISAFERKYAQNFPEFVAGFRAEYLTVEKRCVTCKRSF